MHRFLAFIIITLLCFAGCDNAPPPPAARTTVPAGTGVIHGVVRFIGTPPPVEIIGGPCCPGSEPVPDESLCVNPNSTLKNVVIHIKDGPNIAIDPPKDRVLAQKDCRYVPHVLAMRTGQGLVITNHDQTLHNVDIQASANRSQNFPEAPGTSHAVTFELPERVRFKCAVHPWMTAYAYVFDHPCFAVTGDDGSFEIDHLPPGTYTLVAEHEKLETRTMQVTVSADKPAEVTFEYRGQ